ncbi:MAG: ABC transporter ATP-binding protein [Phycisphaerae bacterium]
MRRDTDRVHRIIYDLIGEAPSRPGEAGRDIRRMWRTHLCDARHLVVWALLCTIVWSIIPGIFSLTWKFLIDSVLLGGRDPIPDDRKQHYTNLAILFFTINSSLWIVRLTTHWLRQRLMIGAGQSLVYQLRKDLHTKIQSLHVGFFEKTPVGVIVSRVMDDVNRIHRWTTHIGPRGLSSVIQLLVGLAVMFYFNWMLGGLVLISLPLYAYTYYRLRPLVRRCHRAMRRLVAKMYARSSERIGGIKVVKSFAREQTENRKFARLIHNYLRLSMRMVKYNQGLALVAGLLTATNKAVVIYIGVRMVQNGTMEVGSLLGFISAMTHTFMAVGHITIIATAVQGALVVLRRVYHLLDEEEQVPPGNISMDGMVGKIHFDHVSYQYHQQDKHAVRDIDLRIETGEKVAIMGPSGSGKSTLFQLLLRFYDPIEGAVRVGGVDLRDADPSSVRHHICMVQQEPTVFSGSIAENIRYGHIEADLDDIELAAKRAELHDFIKSLPRGYDSEVGENGISLSGGQKQRLALAAALLSDPEVLLLDDTTSALDAATEAKIRKTLDHVLEGRTSLIITQRIATARTCDRIIVLEKGKVSQKGTHEELRDTDGFYRDVCIEQDEV